RLAAPSPQYSKTTMHQQGHSHDSHAHADHVPRRESSAGGAPDHNHSHGHSHEHHGSPANLVADLLAHKHDAADSLDDALAGSAEGIRAVKISLLGLGATALIQLMVVLVSGSVALLADTIHNFADAATAIPLWLAFSVSRRA